MSEIVKTDLPVSALTVATATKSDIIAKKHIIIETPRDNSAIVYVALAYESQVQDAVKPSRDVTAFEPFAPYEAKRYSAPKGKRIYYVFYYSKIAGQTLSYVASDAELGRSLVHDSTIKATIKEVKEGFCFVELWEKEKFDPQKYIGRTGSYFKSEAKTTKDALSLPPITGSGWFTTYIDMRNTLDGTTVDEIYFAIPQASKRWKMRFDAKIPVAKAGYDLWLGFEVVGAGGHAISALHITPTVQELIIRIFQRDGTMAEANQTIVLTNTTATTYELIWDGRTLTLSEYLAGTWTALANASVSIPATALIGDYYIPFFANESSVVTDADAFHIGVIQVWRFDDELPIVPFIYNVTMTNADTEYSQALPQGTKKFLVHTRDESAFRLAFVTGKVATPTAPYLTILANTSYYEDHVKLVGNTLYFASPDAGKIIEIVCWR